MATYTQWGLTSIFDRDDMHRLERIFITLRQLVGEAFARELALKALWDASERNAPVCSNWLAKITAGKRPPLNPPALHTAIANQKASAAKYLARHSLKREINSVADAGLLLAASGNEPELIEVFRPRANVKKVMAGGGTALMAATAKGSASLSALLPLSDREQRDKNGFNALMHAIRHCNEEALALLLNEASDNEINGKAAGGKSARELAEEIQKEGHWIGRLGFSRRQFMPLNMMMARIEFFEISSAADAARAENGPVSRSERRPRRL